MIAEAEASGSAPWEGADKLLARLHAQAGLPFTPRA
jgi:hypothetical protein